MRGEWAYFKGFFSPEECKQIVEAGLNIPAERATIGYGDSNVVDNEFRRTNIRWLQRNDSTWDQLYQGFEYCAKRANEDYFGVEYNNLPYIQLAEYDAKFEGEYKRHEDVFWVTDSPYHRKLTVVVQLSDPKEYEGGKFEFFDCAQYPDADEIIQQGTVIVFPSLKFHAMQPITKGVRYSLAGWFEGPKWR